MVTTVVMETDVSAALKELEVATAIAVEIVIEVDKTTEITEIIITKTAKELMFELLRLTRKTSRTLKICTKKSQSTRYKLKPQYLY